MISESAWSKCLSLTSLRQQTNLGIANTQQNDPDPPYWIPSVRSGEVGIKKACKHMDKSHRCILLVHAYLPCSCCFLHQLSVFSSSCHVWFLRVICLYVKAPFQWWRWTRFFCSQINILASSQWVCRDANLQLRLHLFCSLNCVLCQRRGLLWGENKSSNYSLHRSGICKYCIYIRLLSTAEWDYTRAPEKMDEGRKP